MNAFGFQDSSRTHRGQSTTENLCAQTRARACKIIEKEKKKARRQPLGESLRSYNFTVNSASKPARLSYEIRPNHGPPIGDHFSEIVNKLAFKNTGAIRHRCFHGQHTRRRCSTSLTAFRHCLYEVIACTEEAQLPWGIQNSQALKRLQQCIHTTVRIIEIYNAHVNLPKDTGSTRPPCNNEFIFHLLATIPAKSSFCEFSGFRFNKATRLVAQHHPMLETKILATLPLRRQLHMVIKARFGIMLVCNECQRYITIIVSLWPI